MPADPTPVSPAPLEGEPKPVVCPFCDFGSGHRGMDTCGKCKGTGSVFRVGRAVFSNTEVGFNHAYPLGTHKHNCYTPSVS